MQQKENYFVEDELWKRIKAQAALKGLKISEWISMVIEKELEKENKTEAK